MVACHVGYIKGFFFSLIVQRYVPYLYAGTKNKFVNDCFKG